MIVGFFSAQRIIGLTETGCWEIVPEAHNDDSKTNVYQLDDVQNISGLQLEYQAW